MDDSSQAASQGVSAVDGPSIPKIERSAAPLRQNVVDALRTAIIKGKLAPGARLTERDLIEMTGVSRTVIREALRQLESEGVIETIPNKGPIVRKLTLTEAKDLYLIRSVLEGLAARMFIANAGGEDLADLKRGLDETVSAYRGGEPEEILEAKNRFYDIMFQGAGSETLSSMIGTLHARIWRWRALGLGHPKRSRSHSQDSIKGLRSLFKAIEEGNADGAEEIARDQVTKASEEVIKLLAEEN
jgi:GntR family transcriptional regulator, trigonelline degradation regulator